MKLRGKKKVEMSCEEGNAWKEKFHVVMSERGEKD
jgi:hypothetical protein